MGIEIQVLPKDACASYEGALMLSGLRSQQTSRKADKRMRTS